MFAIIILGIIFMILNHIHLLLWVLSLIWGTKFCDLPPHPQWFSMSAFLYVFMDPWLGKNMDQIFKITKLGFGGWPSITNEDSGERRNLWGEWKRMWLKKALGWWVIGVHGIWRIWRGLWTSLKTRGCILPVLSSRSNFLAEIKKMIEQIFY